MIVRESVDIIDMCQRIFDTTGYKVELNQEVITYNY